MENKLFWGIITITSGIILLFFNIKYPNMLFQSSTNNKYRIKDFISIFGEKIGRLIVKIFYWIIATVLLIVGIIILII
jgi:hypothetical protein